MEQNKARDGNECRWAIAVGKRNARIRFAARKADFNQSMMRTEKLAYSL
ncbi:MAG: hypothetical protein VB104_00825 [Candidatus Limiplasma sp.]|nr:hypothetical protein [Candidatus Limiplasma sp.]